MVLKKRVAIVGSGPAGLSASIQLSRFGIDHFIFERLLPGGLLRNGNRISNYTGIYPFLPGRKLSEKMVDHFKSFSNELIPMEIERVFFDNSNSEFKLESQNSTYFSDFLIAASGTRPIKLDLINSISGKLKEFIHYDINSLSELSGRKILIIGSGDCAFDYSLSLAESNDLVLINRSKKVSALKTLCEEVFSNGKISYRPMTEMANIVEGVSKPLKVELVSEKLSYYEEFDIIVVAIGREPEDRYLSFISQDDQTTLIKNGVLIKVGDVGNGLFRQALIAAGNGIESAMKINFILNGVGDGCSI